jgi:hypothetical protein
VLEGAAHFQPQIRSDTRERALDRDQAITLAQEIVVAAREIRGGHAQQIAVVAVREQRAGAAAQVARERTRVAAEHGQHQERAAADAPIAMVERDGVEQAQVAQDAEQRQKRERDQPVRVLARHALDQLEPVRGRDAIELRAELERGQRIEERRLR